MRGSRGGGGGEESETGRGVVCSESCRFGATREAQAFVLYEREREREGLALDRDDVIIGEHKRGGL